MKQHHRCLGQEADTCRQPGADHTSGAVVDAWLHDYPAPGTFTSMTEVRNRRRGATRISSKHQITIPADALRAAGLEIGDRVVAHADGAGRVVLEREHDLLAEFAGAMTGAYTTNELDDLRREWD
jgi:bifunctional DNA-binding transcriptional regulator/antitoxin component of YhaV-PrlF toxin-antitoxin module